MSVPLIASFVLLLASLYTDLLWRKIPNLLTLSSFAFALWFYMNILGPDAGSAFVIKGTLAGMVFLILPFILGGCGGGDVKLFGALGALLGGTDVCSVFVYAAVTGGIFSLFLLIKRGEFHLMSTILNDTVFVLLSKGRRHKGSTSERIPYSLPVIIGFFAYMAFGGIFGL